MTKPVPKHAAQMKSPNENEKVAKFCTMRELNASERKLFATEIAFHKRKGSHPVLIEKFLYYVPYLSVKPKTKFSDKTIDAMISWWEAQRSSRKATK